MNRIILTIVAAIFAPALAGASYFVVPVTASTLDPNLRTHIVVAGRGDDLGNQPMMAASARIKKIQEAYPSDQILFIAGVQDAGTPSLLRRMGFPNFHLKSSMMTTKLLFSEMTPFQQIASFHIYGHSTITPGIFLDGSRTDTLGRWSADSAQNKTLIGHFTEDAVATLNGCNSAHLTAPKLSSLWGIPVSGSLTGTHFEALFEDGQYYSADASEKESFAKTTLGTSAQTIACEDGACLRMRPDNADYEGHYGKYNRGLPFYKVFCSGLEKDKCLSGMAHLMLMTVSVKSLGSRPSMQDYATVVRDWLCPSTSRDNTRRADCESQLARIDVQTLNRNSAELFYTPFRGHMASCSFETCYADAAATCKASATNMWECAKVTPSPAPGTSQTFVREYLNYMRAYSYIK